MHALEAHLHTILDENVAFIIRADISIRTSSTLRNKWDLVQSNANQTGEENPQTEREPRLYASCLRHAHSLSLTLSLTRSRDWTQLALPAQPTLIPKPAKAQ